MTWDQRPYFGENPAESQTAEGGTNANDNCVPTSFTDGMVALGYQDVAPQAWTDYEYGYSYHGTESFVAAQDFIENSGNYANPPAVTVNDISEADLPGVLDEYGAMGYPLIVAWCCDCATVTIGLGCDCGHASPVLAHDTDHDDWIVWNVWDGHEQHFTTAGLQQAYLGGVGVIMRSMFPPPPAPPPEDEDDMMEVGVGGHPVEIAPDEYINLASEQDGTEVRLDGDDGNGNPTGVFKTFTLKGNVANVHGPGEVSVSAADMGITSPGGVINVTITPAAGVDPSTVKVTIWTHTGSV